MANGASEVSWTDIDFAKSPPCGEAMTVGSIITEAFATVISWLAVALFPELSTAVQVTTVVPTGKPFAGALFVRVGEVS